MKLRKNQNKKRKDPDDNEYESKNDYKSNNVACKHIKRWE